MIGDRPATEDEVKAMYDELGRQRERLQKEYNEVQKFVAMKIKPCKMTLIIPPPKNIFWR